MRKSAAISIALHLAILLWVLVVFPAGRALDAPKIEDVPIDIVTPSGKTKSVLARANAVRRDTSGHAERVIGVWRDVTARKSSLRQIEETHKRWERAVAGTSDGLFDWDLVAEHDMGAMGMYLVFGRNGKQLGGMFDKGAQGKPGAAYWLGYVSVTDLEGTVERAKAARGSVLMGPMDVPGGDRIAQLMDPYGAFFALHKPAAQGAAAETGKAAAGAPAKKAASKEPPARKAAKKVPAKRAKPAAKKKAKKAAKKKAARKPAKAKPKKKAAKKAKKRGR